MSPSLRRKLEAMAERGTEHEAAIARAKLEAAGSRMPPPPPPTRNASGSFYDEGPGSFSVNFRVTLNGTLHHGDSYTWTFSTGL